MTYTGSGELTETWLSGQRWRWTASLGNYSQVRIGSGNVGFDETPVRAVPMWVHLLRNAIFCSGPTGFRRWLEDGRNSMERQACNLPPGFRNAGDGDPRQAVGRAGILPR